MNEGELRLGQVITTFGPGAMIDLPDVSVIVGGLELWSYPTVPGRRPIYEPRLQAQLARRRNVAEVKLYAPPVDPDDPTQFGIGIKVVRMSNVVEGLVAKF